MIVGTGDLAYALAHLYNIHNSTESGNFLEVTKSTITESGATFHETGVPLVPVDEALENADIVILAIPGGALKSFIPEHIMELKDKVLVDCTNSRRKGEDVDTLLRGTTGIRFVKAFNDLGAADILANKAATKKKPITNMCSPSRGAIDVVRRFAEQSFGVEVQTVPYQYYNKISKAQNSIGSAWSHSIYIMLVTFVLTEFYASWRYNVEKGYAWFHLPIQVQWNLCICLMFAILQISSTTFLICM